MSPRLSWLSTSFPPAYHTSPCAGQSPRRFLQTRCPKLSSQPVVYELFTGSPPKLSHKPVAYKRLALKSFSPVHKCLVHTHTLLSPLNISFTDSYLFERHAAQLRVEKKECKNIANKLQSKKNRKKKRQQKRQADNHDAPQCDHDNPEEEQIFIPDEEQDEQEGQELEEEEPEVEESAGEYLPTRPRCSPMRAQGRWCPKTLYVAFHQE
ncbi:hypothetical protein NX059_003035 [Plenodomus lindquistii]|nr:hypothetical protein NX059_003035 [Plenodomus lindquistii]